MPIRPEKRALYPRNWRQISEHVRAKAGQRCEWCGKPNRRTVACAEGGRWHDIDAGYWRDAHGRYIPKKDTPRNTRTVHVVLTVAHLDHTPQNCDLSNLRALCQGCHLRYDAPQKAAERKKRKAQAALPLGAT